jgi:hypothetical protein
MFLPGSLDGNTCYPLPCVGALGPDAPRLGGPFAGTAC